MEMLTVLKAFAEICKEHDIQWWLCSGTLLGAARHGGFIPWDDDIDVSMYPKDYRKLLADNFCDTFDALTCTCEHHKSKNCKTDVCQQEAKKCCEPLVGCIEAEIWWENKVTCAKEHGKQSKTHDENVFEMLFLVDHSLPLIIIVDFSCDS